MQALYSLIRPFLFRMDPEKAHEFTLNMLQLASSYGLDGLFSSRSRAMPVEVMGMTFPNPVGLAAGLDKNAEYLDALGHLGFGFIEVGTVTPRPQDGNPKPRMFRFPGPDAIINRMGFNNHGVDAMIENLKKTRYRGILGINIGKNATTPIENAVDDYLVCMNKVYQYANYITVNISSPNTKNLRDLQSEDALGKLLTQLKMRQKELAEQTGRYVPFAVKIAPDLDKDGIEAIARQLYQNKIDGVIATNTTLSRNGLSHLPASEEAGGMSGAPLNNRATSVVRELSRLLGEKIPVIGVGGITRGSDALEKMDAGAALVQLYSGLIFRGPGLIQECIDTVGPSLRQKQEARKTQTRAPMPPPIAEIIHRLEAEAAAALEQEAAAKAAEEAANQAVVEAPPVEEPPPKAPYKTSKEEMEEAATRALLEAVTAPPKPLDIGKNLTLDEAAAILGELSRDTRRNR